MGGKKGWQDKNLLLRLLLQRSKRSRRLFSLPLSHIFPSSSSSSSSSFSHLHTAINPQEVIKQEEEKLLSLFKHCSTIKHLQQIHAQIIHSSLDQNVFIMAKLITFCALDPRKSGSMDYALSVFQQIEFPDGFLWNTMIRGFGNADRPKEALCFYRRMLGLGEAADNFTFSFLLKICGQLGAPELGKQVHCSALKCGLDSHAFVRNTLIHMYGTLGQIQTARRLFDEIPKLDLVSWNTIMDGYVQCGQCEEALSLFSRMQRSGLRPDEATLVIVLSACANLGALDTGSWVHSLIGGTGLDQIVSVCNSLIDMYAKCGEIDSAFRVFDGMSERNVVSWNAMILGFAMHGHAEKALELFTRIRERKLPVPNDVTFLGVLCACSHRGLVQEGRQYFDSMRFDYSIKPTIKHYGCMVDLLGRAGLVEDAYELIRSMPVECNAIVWRTLLGACRIHGNVRLGERVRRHLLELEPDHSGDYVLLSNIYATAGRWDDALNVREAMRKRGVEKPEPGNSLIDVQNVMDFLERLKPKERNQHVSGKGGKNNSLLCAHHATAQGTVMS